MQIMSDVAISLKKGFVQALKVLGAVAVLIFIECLLVPKWMQYFIGLLAPARDSFLAAIGTTWLGFHQVWVVPLLIIVVGIMIVLSERGRGAVKDHWQEVKLGTRVTLIALLIYYVPIFCWSYIKAIYSDHATLYEDNRALREEKAKSLADIAERKYNIRVNEPAYEHMRAIYAAYAGFRRTIGKDTSCQIKITAPEDSGASGPIIRQLADPAGVAANCAAFGPMIAAMDPTVEPEATNGMEAGVLIIHTRSDQVGSLALYDAFAPYIPVKRSFSMPKNSPNVLVWFQFGKDVRWIR
jgi:hypothetical protein